MSVNLQSNPNPSSLFASIDMGTNSFKLSILHADPSGRFLVAIDKLKEPVVLSRESPTSISPQSQQRALQSLRKFKSLVLSYNVPLSQIRCVATETVRHAENQRQFVQAVRADVGFEVDVLSGEEEARLVYLGVLQFLPVSQRSVLCLDIGGGSTEFVVGRLGGLKLAVSLKLGHVDLTQNFIKNGYGLLKLRQHIRSVIEETELVGKIEECGGFEIVVGSSGTIRAIENAVFHGYWSDSVTDNNNIHTEDYKRDWRFCRRELRNVVQRLCNEHSKGEEEDVRRDMFFKARSEFIVAGAVLLEEIFEALQIKELEVSAYGLGEGVIASALAKTFSGYDLKANSRWSSVVRLATRFNGKKKMKPAIQCARIAKAVFEGLMKCKEPGISMDDKDLEYLEAACMLHDIGVSTGKKGYHKQSYRIIKDMDHLQGYNVEEIKLIALLTRYHRKKFPKFDHGPLKEFPLEAKQNFLNLCSIIRIAVILLRHRCKDLQEVEMSESHGSFKLVLKHFGEESLLDEGEESTAEKTERLLKQELERFKTIFKKELIVVHQKAAEYSNPLS